MPLFSKHLFGNWLLLEVFVTVFWYNCFASTSTWSRLPVATSFSFICWPQSQICSTKVLNQAETSKQHMRTWHAFSNCSDKIRLSLLFQASMSSLVLRPWTWRRSLMCVKTNCMHELKCIQLKFMQCPSKSLMVKLVIGTSRLSLPPQDIAKKSKHKFN